MMFKLIEDRFNQRKVPNHLHVGGIDHGWNWHAGIPASKLAGDVADYVVGIEAVNLKLAHSLSGQHKAGAIDSGARREIVGDFAGYKPISYRETPIVRCAEATVETIAPRLSASD